MPSQLIYKQILNITRSPLSQNDIDIRNIILGILYDAFQREFALTPAWNIFCRGGQFENANGDTKAQIASDSDHEGDSAASLWAIRLRVRDASVKRRNWAINIGMKQVSADTFTVYYGLSVSDHLAGSFTEPQPIAFRYRSLINGLLDDKHLQCVTGKHSLPPMAAELRHPSLPEFLEILSDTDRTIPLALITCADLVMPEELSDIARGNLIVYWCEDLSVVLRLNELVPPALAVEWDSIRIYLPINGDAQFHPSFSAAYIERVGHSDVVSGIYQAFCQGLRSEDRRAFVTVDDILKQRNAKYQAALQERIAGLGETARGLAAQLARKDKDLQELQARFDDLTAAKDTAETAEYEALLSETIAEVDALKEGIASLSACLYSDMGKSFKPEMAGENPRLLELAHAIFACLARARGHK